MTEVVVEYLAVAEEAQAFCKDVEGFRRLVQVDGSIKWKRDAITFTDGFACQCHIIQGDVPDKGQLYFHLKFTKAFPCDPPDEMIESFSQPLKSMRGIISKAGGTVTVLRDDVSRHYSMKSYPLIYEIGNLMRRLIKHFLLINVGSSWVSESLPSELKATADNNKRKDKADLLEGLDFIHLSGFLLKPISRMTGPEIYAKVRSATTLDELDAVKDLLPQSNWQRHFSAIVDCEDQVLEKKWNELYDLRCLIAHNTFIQRSNFQRIVELTDELRSILTDALRKLPQVEVSTEDKKLILSEPVQNAIDRLPDRERLTVSLYFFEGLTQAEIGRVLAVSPGRISQLLVQARLRLRGYLQRDAALNDAAFDRELFGREFFDEGGEG